MIEVRGLSKRFGAIQALRDVDFSAADGCITGLLGPNGAGKSTALRILCTVLQADRGSATLDGMDIRTHPIAVRRRIGVLPHNANLYANLTARGEHRLLCRLARSAPCSPPRRSRECGAGPARH